MSYRLMQFKWHILLVFVFLCLGNVIYRLTQPVTAPVAEKAVIVVKSGMAANEIGELLYQQGMIKSVLAFHAVAKMQGLANSLQAGEYVVNKNMTIQQIVAMLAKGETVYQQITIPEGYTVDQIAKLIQEKQLGSAEKFKALAKNSNVSSYPYMMNYNANVVYKVEGYLFPNTYQITKGATEEQLLNMMITQFDKELSESMRERATAIGLSVKDVIILASLVEKEAQIEGDRPIIAGVFLNRLKQEMPLQSCATIQYILGYPKVELSVEDTEISSPYNTYQHMGLPPGPIANPGMAAINAVLYPKETSFIYFVADKQGAHHFSKTYEEHLAAIEQVRK
ncbi:endolytic transglycosylase MltG [Pelosinus sp. UFO1]|uniref:endolytic transglycosylase MltG n=1 Tax=Pelosinus sp. UFO1 TaxID=484770 RepID=UPI0004D1C208|nr:endolytic transglycosylase MltG [Pelosinus sp. UFO1]AIF51480.1 aminodeoxychorismate lyase [Pelosinus sp. UFO1]